MMIRLCLVIALLLTGCSVKEERKKQSLRVEKNQKEHQVSAVDLGAIGSTGVGRPIEHDIHIITVDGEQYIVVESSRGIAIHVHKPLGGGAR